MIASTCPASSHSRAMDEPTSALFWWSADTISTGMPRMVPPTSSTAIFAASTEPSPPSAE